MKVFGLLRSRGVRVVAAATATSLAIAVPAHAALPAWASDLSTDVGEAISDTSAAVGPLVIASLVAVIIIRLIKRFANKI